jgi:hypothetical protein
MDHREPNAGSALVRVSLELAFFRHSVLGDWTDQRERNPARVLEVEDSPETKREARVIVAC